MEEIVTASLQLVNQAVSQSALISQIMLVIFIPYIFGDKYINLSSNLSKKYIY